MLRVGIDTGGTNTDLVAIDEQGGIVISKRPSTVAAPEIGVLDAFDGSGIAPEEVRHFVLGTTIATNARLQGTGARVLYLATEGFQDIPLIGSISRPYAYDLSWRKPDPGVLRRDCFGVVERIDYKGGVVTPLTQAEIARVLDQVEEALGTGCSIAVNFLFSYRNAEHERALGEALCARFPTVPVSLSHEVAPIWREYHRATTTILAASVRPMLQSFITDLERELSARSLGARLAIMKSNGGQMLSDHAPDRSAEVFLSGLAGGVIGGHYFAAVEGSTNAVTFDMGGTSCDVGVIDGGDYRSVPQIELDWGIHVVAPHIDFTTIGAGGGSIAHVGQDGLLKVGPQSAGAEPGPACYGKGGTEPTVTDANVVLGRIDPDFFLGGRVNLDRSAARNAVDTIARALDLSAEEAALAIIETVNDNMAIAVRRVTIERGLDYRDFDLIAFGGAGPLHGTELARSVGMRRTLVPLYPGLCSAFGTVVADVRVEKSLTVSFRSDDMALADIADAFAALEAQALDELREEGFDGEAVLSRIASARYRLQSHEIDLSVLPSALAGDVKTLIETFHAEHERRFDFKTPGAPVEIVRLSVLALGVSEPPILPNLAPGEAPEITETRAVWFRETGLVETPVLHRDMLGAGAVIEGPAVILEEDSTVIVAPGDRLFVTEKGVLEIAATEESGHAPGRHYSGGEPDLVTLNVIRNRLDAICDEMDLEALRTAHSPLFSESKDFSCMLFDRDLQLISQAQNNPAIICAGLSTVPFVVEELGESYFEPGDVVVHNDPYRGACHMPEHMLLEGIFVDDELVGYAAIIAHIAEIGGMVPGSFAVTASEVYQEGLRLPPIKLMKRGEHVEELWKVILANHRTPDATFGDFHAMLASLKVAARRMPELIHTYGLDTLRASTKALNLASERWMREQISAIPDGIYSFDDRYEDDPRRNVPHVFRVDVNVEGDEIVVDYSRSDKQVDAAINLTYVATAAATYTGILQSINVRDVPLNQGVFRPISMIAPPGSLLNVQHPGSSVGGNSDGQPRVINAIWGAMSQALPDRACAADGGTNCLFPMGGVHPETGEYFAHLHLEGGGWGARKDYDGNTNLFCAHGSTIEITPIEILESRYPLLHVACALREDSGGPGRNRGGLSVMRRFIVQAPELTVSALADRHFVGPWGLFGGLEGGRQSFLIKQAGDTEFRTFAEVFGVSSPTKFDNITVRHGDELLFEAPGGGGYGDPLERAPARVLADVQNRNVSLQAAETAYGVMLFRQNGTLGIDEPATEALRNRRRETANGDRPDEPTSIGPVQ